MTNSWLTCPSEIKDNIFHLLSETKEILKEEFIGFYLHGSLAMGGFNPNGSDIDILVVTNKSISIETKRKLAQILLVRSTTPYPMEISCMNVDQLNNWQHPSLFDFHYSECWRKRYEDDLENRTFHYLNGEIKTDADLAAHITITHNRGICIEGKSIDKVFPLVPRSHYVSSIMGDFNDCLINILKDPVYCTLNLIRVFWYLKEGNISSKQEAGHWGVSSLPKEMSPTIQKVVNSYLDKNRTNKLVNHELIFIRNYIAKSVRELLMNGSDGDLQKSI